jgi:3,4-dihydroxy 2-butanone 4-phosphate synthase/GTP cyclohydrolase II
VSVLAEIVSDREPSAMARGPELREFADRHELALISVESLARYQLEHQPYVHRSAQVRVPLAQGGYTVVGYRSTYDGREHLAFVLGDVAGHPMPLVKIRYEAESGEQPGAPGLRCGTADDDPLGELISAGCGAVVYFRVDGVAATDSGDRGMNSRDQDSRRADLPPRLDARDAAAVDQILADLDLIRAADTAGQSDTATRSLQQATADLARTAVLGMTSADRR